MNTSSTKSYLIILALSALFLLLGNNFATRGYEPVEDEWRPIFYTARITEITSHEVTVFAETPEFTLTDTHIIFNARITTRGEKRGEIITGEQMISDLFQLQEREVSVGDRVILFYDDFFGHYHFANHVRAHYVIGLGVAFFLFILFFGRRKGFSAIVSLGFTCLAIFLVFIPAILNGRNIYAAAIIVCVYAIVSTLLLVVGVNKKALASLLGCLGGVIFAAILMFAADAAIQLTGFIDDETPRLLLLENPIDIRAIIFAGVVIGAVGAIMDVAMSISSSLWELRLTGGIKDFRSIFTSGINIGKDIMGTMLNTLILAYIGSSLSTILLIVAHTTSYMELFNREMIIVELLRALTGSFGMFLAIPLTAAICGWVYAKNNR